MNEKLIYTPALDCADTMCKLWKWEGNSDIVGIGMMFVYMMGATFASLYLLSFFCGMSKESDYTTFKTPTPPKKKGILNNVRSTFCHSLGAFHTGLGLLTVSVLLTTLVICGRKESIYDINTSLLASVILTGMFYLTLPIYLDVEQRHTSGLVLHAIIWLLSIVVISFSPSAARQAEDNGRAKFEAHCRDIKASSAISLIVLTFHIILAV